MARNLQAHILQIASELFYSQGIKATGVDSIVKAAGTTKMSLYKYFPSKDDLVLAHLRQSGEKLRERILCGLEAKATTPEQKLLAIFDVFDELQSTPGFRGCPFINASAEFAAESNPVQQSAAEFSASFRSLLADLATQASLNQPDILAQQLAMLISGAMVAEQIQHQTTSMRTAREAAKVLIAHSATSADHSA